MCPSMPEGMAEHSWEGTNAGRVQPLPPLQQTQLSEHSNQWHDLATLPAIGQLSSPTDYELGLGGAWLVYLK